ncbi:MAG: histidinol-phosphate transaminase [Clostridia bacterium]|nr:histidinol-phosphate transaminase [Clostridia bacterium]
MSYKLDPALARLTPYEPLKGDYAIRLDANESFLPLPEEVLQGALQALSSLDYRRYPDPDATVLCKAYASYLGVDAASLVAGNGSDELISLIINTFLSDGDKIVTVTPDFSMYAFYARVRKAEVIEMRRAADFSFSTEELADFVNKNGANIVVFSNPNNPTGGIITRKEVLSLCEKTDALVIADEAYMDFSDQSVASFVDKYTNLIVLRTMSKAFASAALRVGFAVANKTLITVLRAAKSPYNVNAISQTVGALILQQKGFSETINALIASKNALYQGLKQITDVLGAPFVAHPSSANFVYVTTPKAGEIYQNLLKEGIAVRAFSSALRITAGTQEENKAVLQAIRGLL